MRAYIDRDRGETVFEPEEGDVEFTCISDDCSEAESEDGEVVSRHRWWGRAVGATRTDPGYLEGDECPVCGCVGEAL